MVFPLPPHEEKERPWTPLNFEEHTKEYSTQSTEERTKHIRKSPWEPIPLTLKCVGAHVPLPWLLPSIWDHKRPMKDKAILTTMDRTLGITLPDCKLYFKPLEINTICYWHKNRDLKKVTEYRAQKKPAHICSTDLWQGSQKHTIGKGESLQQMLLGNWLSTHKNMKVNPQQGKQLSVPSHYGDKTVCHLCWQQCGHKGAIQVHFTVLSHVPTTCMDLEAIILCEIRKRDNVKYHGISLISGA